ncbi:MAG: gliding motility-associated ABC transporter permease subunit GldF [Flavobacteriaceae bacterium]|nr:gliding motility-associated ABC transporter permease subunit GldF [Flavobacteriaceae bacterium]
MIAIFRQEIKSFFASPIGYLVMLIFVSLTGLFLWVFDTEFNVFEQGFADLHTFFALAPWLLLFLIPALTMKSFAEEKRSGTMELLLIKPISSLQLVLGKFLGAFGLIAIALAFTSIYLYTVYALGNPRGNIDMGSNLGAYLGLLFLAMAYICIGLFASALTSNQIVAFLLAALLLFACYYGWDAIATLFPSQQQTIASLGMRYHFEQLRSGILDLKNLIYFASISALFISLSVGVIEKIKNQ